MSLSPLLGPLDRAVRVGSPELGDLLVQWVVKVGSGQQRLDGEKHRADLEGGRPLVLEDVQADSSELVNIGMENLGPKQDLGRNHGVLVGEEELTVEKASFVWSLAGACYLDVEMARVAFAGFGIYAYDWVLSEVLSLLQNSGRNCHF